MHLSTIITLLVAFFTFGNGLAVVNTLERPSVMARDSSNTCDSACVRRLFYRTAYSSTATGILEAMYAYRSGDWCINEQSDWCPEMINSTLSTIAGKAATDAASSVDVDNCEEECLVESLATLSNKAGYEAMAWTEANVNGTAMLAGDVRWDRRQAAIGKLHATMEQVLRQSQEPVDYDRDVFASTMSCTCDESTISQSQRPSSTTVDNSVTVKHGWSVEIGGSIKNGSTDGDMRLSSDTTTTNRTISTTTGSEKMPEQGCDCGFDDRNAEIMSGPSGNTWPEFGASPSSRPSSSTPAVLDTLPSPKPEGDRSDPTSQPISHEHDNNGGGSGENDDDDDDDDHTALIVGLPFLGFGVGLLGELIAEGVSCIDPILCSAPKTVLKGVFKGVTKALDPLSWFRHVTDTTKSFIWQGGMESILGWAPRPTKPFDPTKPPVPERPYRESKKKNNKKQPPKKGKVDAENRPKCQAVDPRNVFRAERFNPVTGTLEQQTLLRAPLKKPKHFQGADTLVAQGYKPYYPLDSSGKVRDWDARGKIGLQPWSPHYMMRPKDRFAVTWHKPEDVQSMGGEWRKISGKGRDKYIRYENGKRALSSQGEPLVKGECDVMDTAEAIDSEERGRKVKWADEQGFKLIDPEGNPLGQGTGSILKLPLSESESVEWGPEGEAEVPDGFPHLDEGSDSEELDEDDWDDPSPVYEPVGDPFDTSQHDDAEDRPSSTFSATPLPSQHSAPSNAGGSNWPSTTETLTWAATPTTIETLTWAATPTTTETLTWGATPTPDQNPPPESDNDTPSYLARLDYSGGPPYCAIESTVNSYYYKVPKECRGCGPFPESNYCIAWKVIMKCRGLDRDTPLADKSKEEARRLGCEAYVKASKKYKSFDLMGSDG